MQPSSSVSSSFVSFPRCTRLTLMRRSAASCNIHRFNYHLFIVGASPKRNRIPSPMKPLIHRLFQYILLTLFKRLNVSSIVYERTRVLLSVMKSIIVSNLLVTSLLNIHSTRKNCFVLGSQINCRFFVASSCNASKIRADCNVCYI